MDMETNSENYCPKCNDQIPKGEKAGRAFTKGWCHKCVHEYQFGTSQKQREEDYRHYMEERKRRKEHKRALKAFVEAHEDDLEDWP